MEGKKFVMTEPGGNPREQITQEDILQAVRDISHWLTANVAGFAATAPADPGQIQMIPNGLFGLAEMYGIHDGGILLNETFRTMTLAELAAELEVCRVSAHWNTEFFPFAKSGLGELLIAQCTSGADAGVLHWTHDEGVEEKVADSVAQFIESVRNKMLSGKLEYIDEDLGLCEKV